MFNIFFKEFNRQINLQFIKVFKELRQTEALIRSDIAELRTELSKLRK